ncbi:MAG: primosomal protein N' [Anaerolineaceae bacterium]|nr:primosomal protein N' [Anaerolineaceae bacterium]
MKPFASVSINHAKISRAYDYRVPPELADEVQPGCLVEVPFGKQAAQGVVLALLDSPEVPDPLPITALLSAGTLLTPQQMQLAAWLAEATFAPLGACIKLMIPDGLSRRASMQVWLNEGMDIPEALSPSQIRLVHLLKSRGTLTAGQLDRALPKMNWRQALKELQAAGLASSRNFLPPPVISPKTVRTAQLSIAPQEVQPLERRSARQSEEVIQRRKRVLELLAADPFPVDFSWIYAQSGSNYADLKALAEAGLIHFNETEVWRDPLEAVRPGPNLPPQLTPDQKKIWQTLEAALEKRDAKPCLLFGVTGSGKTEIYLRAVEKALQAGQQALVLVPEISMTPQAVRRFMGRFPNQVGLFHHKLSEGERYDTWRRARSGDLKVVVGPRSALFLPYPKLGLIIIDECDNDSYDEEQREPFYHAPETAEALARFSEARLLLGSATPRVSQFYQARRGEWKLLELPHRIDPCNPLQSHAELPPVQVVDMRQELKSGNLSVFSRSLQKALEETLQRQEQAVLFLNRKGSSTYIFCRDCGEALRCPRDGKALVYHSGREGLLCHVCGYTRRMPSKCPNCGSKAIRSLGLGTEKLESLVQEAFPAARILRWDGETTTEKGSHELILSHFSAHRADILIGTQMLAKGLDLPLVTLVGVLLAEVGLNLPDYRAAERSFQVLTQVSGRAGRGPLGGQVIMQTYQPDSTVIQLAANHDYRGFYEKELEYRKMLAYPPFSRLTKLEYRHLREEKSREHAEALYRIIREEIAARNMFGFEISEPLPAYIPRLGGEYRFQMLLRAADPLPLLNTLPLRGWKVMPDPSDLL